MVHYGADNVRIATATCWVTTLQARLVDLCGIAAEYAPSFNTNWYLEEQCELLRPRIEVVDCTCLGLHMVMPYDIRPESVFLNSDDETMQRLMAMLGG